MKNNVVTISPDIQSGTPVFSGTRVPIRNLFDYLQNGESIADFLLDFPSVKEDQVSNLLTIAENMLTFNFSNEEDSNRRKSA